MITEKGIQTNDDNIHKLDVLVYGTGFKTNPFLLNLDIKGKNKISIHEAWKESPKAYLGITVHQFPNLFLMYGPNTNLGHNSIIIMAEAQASYIAQCVKALQDKQWKTMEVKAETMLSYHHSIQTRLKDMIWNTVEDSWYKSANGNSPNNFPGRTMEYMKLTRQVDFGVFDIE